MELQNVCIFNSHKRPTSVQAHALTLHWHWHVWLGGFRVETRNPALRLARSDGSELNTVHVTTTKIHIFEHCDSNEGALESCYRLSILDNFGPEVIRFARA